MMVSVHGNVEVWCDYTNRWVDGFELTDLGPKGARVRRRSDGRELPILASSEVRPSP